MDVVRRVAKRYGRGVPLPEALAAEGNPKINLESWHKAIQRDDKLSTLYASARGQFLDEAVAKLAASDNLKYLCWLLERRHSADFAKRDSKPSEQGDGERQRATEIPEEILQRATELAKAGLGKHPTSNAQHPTSKGGNG